MTTLLISLGPCHRCGGQMRDSVDGPQCLHCAHFHRSPDHTALIAELLAERARETAGLRRPKDDTTDNWRYHG